MVEQQKSHLAYLVLFSKCSRELQHPKAHPTTDSSNRVAGDKGGLRKVPAFIWGSMGCWLGSGYFTNNGGKDSHEKEAQFISHCDRSTISTPREGVQNPGVSSSVLLGQNYRKRETLCSYFIFL